MKNFDDIEKFIRQEKPHSTTSPRADKLTLDDSFEAMDRAMQTKSANVSIGRKKISTIAIRIAAAAVIIVAIGFFVVRFVPEKKVEIAKVNNATKSPAEMLTLRSLKIAYYNGGMEAVENQCDKAIEKLGPKSKKINVQELLTEINGV